MKKLKTINTIKNIILVIQVLLMITLTLFTWSLGFSDLSLSGLKLFFGSDIGYEYRTMEMAVAQPCVIAIPSQDGMIGAAYKQTQINTLLETVDPIWEQALSEVTSFELATESELKNALAYQTLYMEYSGQIPISVIAGWYGGDIDDTQQILVNSIVLTENGDLYVRETQENQIYKATTTIDSELWGDISQNVSASQCDYAFNMDGEIYEKFYPEKLIMYTSQSYGVFVSRSPEFWQTDTKENLQSLLEAFSYNTELESYSENNGNIQVFIDASSVLRISQDGTIEYKETSDEIGLYAYEQEQVEDPLTEKINFAYKLASSAIDAVDANVTAALESITQNGTKTSIIFATKIDGVKIANQNLAEFTFDEGKLSMAKLNLNIYEATGEQLYTLPPEQFAAISDNELVDFEVCYEQTEDGRLLARMFLRS